MKLYLFRHAEKASLFTPDPALSALGLQQAIALREKVAAGDLPTPEQLWVSPRLRTRQSFQSLAQALGLEMQVHPELDEKLGGENRHQFRERIDRLVQKATAQSGVVFLCSHYDWLEESLQLLACETDLLHEIESHWLPLQYMALQYEENIFKFIESKRVSP